MRPLSAQQVVEAWGLGEDGSAIERSLALLRVACPELSVPALARLSVGDRDARLLLLREKTFGPLLHGMASCTSCNATLSFDLDCREIRAEALEAPSHGPHELELPEFHVTFRLPDSRDMAAAEGCASLEEAGVSLLEACVLQARQGDTQMTPRAIPPEVRSAISARIAQIDPLSEIPVDLSCDLCGNQWTVLLEIGAYFWHEIASLAERLMYDVAHLAQKYSWSEADILALGPARRRYYLEMGDA